MTLGRFVRLAAKTIQGFHVRTRTDISLSMLGWKSVVSQIDYRKLSFLGRLCNMPNTVHAKVIFNARLSIYICRGDNNQKGFVQDVVKVHEKYDLSFELIKYSRSGVFMSYPAWKRTCKQAILKFETHVHTACSYVEMCH